MKKNRLNHWIIGIIYLIILGVIISQANCGKSGPTPEEIAQQKEEQERKAREEKIANAKKITDEIITDDTKNPLSIKELLGKIEKSLSLAADTNYEKVLKEKQAELKDKLEILNEVNGNIESFDKNPDDFTHYKSLYTDLKNKAMKLKNSDTLVNLIEEQIKKINETLVSKAKDKLDELKTQIEDLKTRQLFEDAIALCDSFPEELKKIVTEEIDKIKAAVKDAEEAYKKAKKEQWQVLFGPDKTDTTDWTSYPPGLPCKIAGENSILTLENNNQPQPHKPNQPPMPTESYALIGKSSWTNYTVEIEYKITQGAVTLLVRTNASASRTAKGKSFPIPIQRKFGDEWQKITLEVQGNNVTIKQEGKSDEKKIMPSQTNTSGGIGFQLRMGDKTIIKSIRIKGVE